MVVSLWTSSRGSRTRGAPEPRRHRAAGLAARDRFDTRRSAKFSGTFGSRTGAIATTALGALLSLLPLLFAGCERGGAAETVADSLRAAAARNSITIAAERAKVGPIATFYRTTATLEVEREAQVVARVAGVIEAIDVEEGDEVAEGAILLRIENEELGYRLAQATARVDALTAKLERMKEMSGDLVSEEVVETTRFDLAAAKADQGLARVELEYATVVAPFAGRITHRYVEVGQKVSLETPLFALADFNPLLARVHVPAKEFRSLRVDQKVALTLDSDGTKLEGRVRLVSPVIDPATGTIKVTIEVPEYPAGTRPGDFAQVHIVTETRPEATLVPKLAVMNEKGETFVWVVKGDSAERRVVDVGFTNEAYAEIRQGVAPGEDVVTQGQRALQPGVRVKVVSTDVVFAEHAQP